jgi:hypothetical protein
MQTQAVEPDNFQTLGIGLVVVDATGNGLNFTGQPAPPLAAILSCNQISPTHIKPVVARRPPVT